MVGNPCKAVRLDGNPCNSWAVDGSDFCFTHAPTRVAERAAARKRGGLAKHAKHGGDPALVPGEIRDLAGVLLLLDYAKAEIIQLDNGIPRARALIALCDSYVNAIQTGTLEGKLAELQAFAVDLYEQLQERNDGH